ncbi:MAG: hypothetical protein K5673_04655, partial [Lachnospiraceae bacterium]|nr:hypothetical protein [Lachnospiraceae bacterium]
MVYTAKGVHYLAKALVDGGLPAAEVTFRTAAAEDAIRAIVKEVPDMLGGAGAVAVAHLLYGVRFFGDLLNAGLDIPKVGNEEGGLMKIDRYHNSSDTDDKSRINTPMYNCVLYVRGDFTVSSATEDYYEFVGENSVLPFTELIDSEDADILKDSISNGCREEVELYTRLVNHLDEGWRNVYIKLESSDRTEEGKKLYKINLIDIID